MKVSLHVDYVCGCGYVLRITPDKTTATCPACGCEYAVSFDKTGAFIAVANIPHTHDYSLTVKTGKFHPPV